MTDTERQMIEDAARVIGLDAVGWSEEHNALIVYPNIKDDPFDAFNPLTNPADTYMLMEQLGLYADFQRQWCCYKRGKGIYWPLHEPDAAHAITRCAAEVWRMKK